MHPKTIESNTNQQHVYTLELAGAVDDDFVNSFCPPETVVAREQDTTTISKIHMDQSGIIGLIRSLHNLGLIILSLDCCLSEADAFPQSVAENSKSSRLHKRIIK